MLHHKQLFKMQIIRGNGSMFPAINSSIKNNNIGVTLLTLYNIPINRLSNIVWLTYLMQIYLQIPLFIYQNITHL